MSKHLLHNILFGVVGLFKSRYGFFCIVMLICGPFVPLSLAQCPPNIDFESGNFDSWKCYTGFVSNLGGVNTFNLQETPGPENGRHTLIQANQAYSDPYGGFSTQSPNGSEYCIKLGNDLGGGEAEAVSYEFTIPANRNTYSLIYYYAVVFQDPNHQQYEQPRMEIEITNVTDNVIIPCASFSFIPYGTVLPGFFQSDFPRDNTPIWCKDWSPVSINLDGNAGKTIRLLFRTGDCTFRRHFGYAYIDVATDCSGELPGASFCPEDKEITVAAPFGFKNYLWMNNDRSLTLGSDQTLTLRPPPVSGTSVVVQLTPYDGFGCPQTLTAKLLGNLNTTAFAGNDTISCNHGQVRIGGPPRPGLDYSWSPAEGLSNPFSANPFAAPLVTTSYVLTVKSPGGGCFSRDTVKIVANNLENSLQVSGKLEHCLGSGDSTVLKVSPVQSIQWFKNNERIAGQTETILRISETGKYYAAITDHFGCSITTPVKSVNISSIPVASFMVDTPAGQCLVGNRFAFKNQSTNQSGNLKFRWDFGGILKDTVQEPIIQFPAAGVYRVKMVAFTNSVCADSAAVTVNVYPNPVPLFEATAICVGLPFIPKNLTDENIGSPVHYLWTFGDGKTSTLRNPVQQVFSTPGNYSISLSVFSDQCPNPVQSISKVLRIEKPESPKRFPAVFAVSNVPLILQSRKIGIKVSWLPAAQLSDPTNYKPVFRGTRNSDFLMTYSTEGGCTTVDSLLVQIVEKANIYVPTGFTPNGDELNDYLRPVLMGVKELHYFRVFNRWGQMVYESGSDKPGWNGIFKGLPQPSQTFSWMVEGVGIDGTVIRKKGTSLLVR